MRHLYTLASVENFSKAEHSEISVVVLFYCIFKLISANLRVRSYWDNIAVGDRCFTVNNFDPRPGKEAERSSGPKGDYKMHYLI